MNAVTSITSASDVDPYRRAAVCDLLPQRPDWLYLLREFDKHYRYGSSGGSKPISAHMRAVRERLSKIFAGPTRIDAPQAADLPVTAHLARALDNARMGPTESFARAIEKVAGSLQWQYGYEKMPKSLRRSYGYAEVLGPNGPIISETLILGFVLFAPKCSYPTHRHDGIAESYICVSGAMSENDAGVYVPGSLIFNRPGTEHTITTSDREPVLLAYAWTGDAEALKKPQMVLMKKPRAHSGQAPKKPEPKSTTPQ